MDHRISRLPHYYAHKRNVVYECVDKDAESIPGSIAHTNGALFYWHKQNSGNDNYIIHTKIVQLAQTSIYTNYQNHLNNISDMLLHSMLVLLCTNGPIAIPNMLFALFVLD